MVYGKEHDPVIIQMKLDGKHSSEIGKVLNRSECAIDQRVCKLRKKGLLPPVRNRSNHSKWTKDDWLLLKRSTTLDCFVDAFRLTNPKRVVPLTALCAVYRHKSDADKMIASFGIPNVRNTVVFPASQKVIPVVNDSDELLVKILNQITYLANVQVEMLALFRKLDKTERVG